LAIASRNGIVIATHDKRLQDAARTLQIAFVSP
jgi:predicted nuclease of predicted toxin-antitoxin system